MEKQCLDPTTLRLVPEGKKDYQFKYLCSIGKCERNSTGRLILYKESCGELEVTCSTPGSYVVKPLEPQKPYPECCEKVLCD